ncbi:MAG: MmcQ/YjbR family DNA-binding protein, partial [Polyangiaceae bacterium]
MLTTQIALEKMRELCVSLPDTSERLHLGEATFHVGGKAFASCGDKDGACRFVFALEPEHAEHLLGSDQRFARHPNARECLVLHAAEAKSWAEVKKLVLGSYQLVVERQRAKPVGSNT